MQVFFEKCAVPTLYLVTVKLCHLHFIHCLISANSFRKNCTNPDPFWIAFSSKSVCLFSNNCKSFGITSDSWRVSIAAATVFDACSFSYDLWTHSGGFGSERSLSLPKDWYCSFIRVFTRKILYVITFVTFFANNFNISFSGSLIFSLKGYPRSVDCVWHIFLVIV